MAELSNISWTKSTFNPWLGCTKVGPGCDSCYAETLDKRHRWGGDTHWGDDKPRHRTSAEYWKNPLRWNKKAPESEFAGRKGFWPVFCASLADVFDNKVPAQWRRDLFSVIELTPNLQWLLVTKRIGNVQRMVADARSHDWLAGRNNVRLLITVVNQEEADRDIPKLLALKCKNGISYEPALGPVNWYDALGYEPIGPIGMMLPTTHRPKVEWIIVGGESTQGGGKARPFVHGWARETIEQCKDAGVPVFMKQMGSNAQNREGAVHEYEDRAGADPAEWADDLRVQQFPE